MNNYNKIIISYKKNHIDRFLNKISSKYFFNKDNFIYIWGNKDFDYSVIYNCYY